MGVGVGRRVDSGDFGWDDGIVWYAEGGLESVDHEPGELMGE